MVQGKGSYRVAIKLIAYTILKGAVVGFLVGWLVGWLAGWLVGWLAYKGKSLDKVWKQEIEKGGLICQ